MLSEKQPDIIKKIIMIMCCKKKHTNITKKIDIILFENKVNIK
jgi:hypothetical protein